MLPATIRAAWSFYFPSFSPSIWIREGEKAEILELRSNTLLCKKGQYTTNDKIYDWYDIEKYFLLENMSYANK